MQGRTFDQSARVVEASRDEGQVRAHVHGMWASVAGSWETQAAYVDTRGAEVTERMLELAVLRPGDRVLELACGPGGAGLAAAPLVLPHGHVVLSDVVPEMAAIAGARADALGRQNVSTRVLDLEEIDEAAASYDAVLCREGLMFALDPARAAREIARVLRPGGRFVAAVWGPRARNPWLGLVFDAVSAQFGTPVPPPGVPGPFSLEDADRLAAILRAGSLSGIAVEAFPVPVRAASFEEWWTRTRALAGPLAARLAQLPPTALEALESRLREAVQPYESTCGLEIPGEALLARATR